MDKPLFALRYLTRFQCIAERCEDSCCTTWSIRLSPEDRQRLEQAIGADELRTKATEDGLALTPANECAFLQPDRLCSVIRRHGAAALPDACSLFPRVISYLPERIEVNATLGCPEAARLCLLAGDAVDQVPAPATISERIPPEPPRRGADAYASDEVRAFGLEILSDQSLPLAARIGLLALFGERVAPFFFRGAKPFAPERLGAELERARGSRDELFARFAEVEVPGPTALQAVASVLQMVQTPSERFARVQSQAMQRYLIDAMRLDPRAGQAGGPPIWELIWAAFENRRARFDGTLGAFAARYFHNWCINDWFREWYTHSPSLLSHAFRMALRLLSLRFLLQAHPGVEALMQQAERGEAISPAELDACAVETFQVFCKYVERSGAIAAVDAGLKSESLGLTPLGRVLAFCAAV